MVLAEPQTPRLEFDKFLRHVGGKSSHGASSSLRKKYQTYSEIIAEKSRPKIVYRHINVTQNSKGRVDFAPGARLVSPKLARTLRPCPEAVAFAATLGPQVCDAIQDLTQEGRVSSAYVLDAMASLAAETLVEQFQRRMARRLAQEGKGVTLRFSPGYCDWPVTQQKQLFSLLDAGRVGITLSSSCLMTPRKSVSGIFGVYEKDQAGEDARYIPCWDCQRSDCSSRRADRRTARPN